MFIGIAIVLVLISMGGLIAFLGDRIGSKMSGSLYSACPNCRRR